MNAAATGGFAAALGADYLRVSGDTFEENAVNRTLVRQPGEILSRIRGPVYLMPADAVPGGTLSAAPLREMAFRTSGNSTSIN